MANNTIIQRGLGGSLLIALIFGGVIAFSALKMKAQLKEQKTANEQLSVNYKALLDTLNTYQVKVDKLTKLNVAVVYRAAVDVSEWKEKNKKDAELIKKMGVSLNKLQSVANTSVVTSDTIVVDKIIYKDRQTDYTFNSDYMSAKVKIDNVKPELSKLEYEYKNKLLLTNEFEQRKFLFFKLGKRYRSSHIVSLDKNCKITKFEYNEMIK